MKKWWILLLILALIVLGSTYYSYSQKPLIHTTYPAEEGEIDCFRTGGEWGPVGNPCMETCYYDYNNGNVPCTQEVVNSCTCKEDKCWNGKSCIELKDYNPPKEEEENYSIGIRPHES